MYRYINCGCLETPLLQTLIILWTRVNFLWLRKGKVAFLGFFFFIDIRYRCLGKLFQATLTWRWNINWPILHLCFPSGPDEQLQSLSTDTERTEKMNNNGIKFMFLKTSQCEVKRRWMMAQKESDTKSTRAKYFWKYCSRNKNLTVFAVASLVCFRTATLVAVCPVQRYTSSIVLTGQPRTRRLKPRKSITCSLNKYQLNKLRWRINETT